MGKFIYLFIFLLYSLDTKEAVSLKAKPGKVPAEVADTHRQGWDDCLTCGRAHSRSVSCLTAGALRVALRTGHPLGSGACFQNAVNLHPPTPISTSKGPAGAHGPERFVAKAMVSYGDHKLTP